MFPFYFLLKLCFLIPQQGYQWDAVPKVRQESSLWPLTLPWPTGLRFIRAVLLLSSPGSSTVQRHSETPSSHVQPHIIIPGTAVLLLYKPEPVLTVENKKLHYRSQAKHVTAIVSMPALIYSAVLKCWLLVMNYPSLHHCFGVYVFFLCVQLAI